MTFYSHHNTERCRGRVSQICQRNLIGTHRNTVCDGITYLIIPDGWGFFVFGFFCFFLIPYPLSLNTRRKLSNRIIWIPMNSYFNYYTDFLASSAKWNRKLCKTSTCSPVLPNTYLSWFLHNAFFSYTLANKYYSRHDLGERSDRCSFKLILDVFRAAPGLPWGQIFRHPKIP